MSQDNQNISNGTDTAAEEPTIGANASQPSDGPIRDPQDWKTGDEPMTDAQRSYLDTLAKEAGEQLPAKLTKAEASQHIDRLRQGNDRVQ
jgi:Protein of unknown function (DUF3072)